VSQPNSLRIILRTGQPGVAPEERVLNEYDVDHYLAKVEATPQKLYGLIRSCLRSSRDIATLSAFAGQLRNFTKALQNLSSMADLLVFMEEGLAFLESKHAASSIFYASLDADNAPRPLGGGVGGDLDAEAIRSSLRSRDWSNLETGRLHPLDGEEAHSFFVPFGHEENAAQPAGDGEDQNRGALCVFVNGGFGNDSLAAEFCSDACVFIENWKIAHGTLTLQERLARERMLREKMYYERLQAIATMVAGVAHEMNTPLGIANTASSMIRGLVEDVADVDLPEDEREEVVADMAQSCSLLEKNLERAHRLISSFKQLSASQMSDSRFECDLSNVVTDCVQSMYPALKKKNVTVTVEPLPDSAPRWDGFPGHLSQAIVNLITNTLRYAYDDAGGTVTIRLLTDTLEGAQSFRIEYEDYGKGIAPDILPRIFDPFVTSGRSLGGTGLGLSITHNIATNLLGGSIEVATEAGKGAKFTLNVPQKVPDPTADPIAAPVRQLAQVSH
ncbi:sensor histidine kinase, partial [Planctomycetota bacterium]